MRTFNWKDVGKRISEIRGKESRELFAKKLNTHFNTIGNYERGARKPDIDILFKLHEIGVNLNWLLSGDGEMYRDSMEQCDTVCDTRTVYAHKPADRWETLYSQLLDTHVCIDEVMDDIAAAFHDTQGLDSVVSVQGKTLKREIARVEKTLDQIMNKKKG